MDFHNAQLLVLAVFLASPLALPDRWWSGGWQQDGEPGAPLLSWRWGGGAKRSGPAPPLGWADSWMQDWATEQEGNQAADHMAAGFCGGTRETAMRQALASCAVPAGSLGECTRGGCRVKKFLPRRVDAHTSQVVPHVIWQTWKDTEPGSKRFEGMNSMVVVNPEYDYVLFTDDDCRRFMCEFADPDALLAYEVLVPKAAKADIWRLAVILRYGGIYVDSDVKAIHPFREYLWANASAASGMGRNKDFHQWLLAYAPGHPIIAEALRAVTSTVLAAYREHRWMAIIPMTGPDRFHFHGVATVLKRNGCSVDKDTAGPDGLQLVRQGHPCEQTQAPEPIGVVQVFDKDHFGGAVKFKVDGLLADANKAGEVRYTAYTTWETGFVNATGRCET